jgi:excisionase family DNA binding protein
MFATTISKISYVIIVTRGVILEEYISLEEAAQICNVTRAAIYRWQKNGRIILYKKGSRTVVKRSDIEKIKKENEEIRPFK